MHRPKSGEATDLSRRDFLSWCVGGAIAPVLAGGGLPLLGRRPRLVVWSCGGNHHLLLDFHQWFEREHGCQVVYASAPVEHLISVVERRPQKVHVLVGRSGPGWDDLGQARRLAGPPKVFALDPYVIIVPKGNPGRVRSVADLKRPDVKTVYSPRASGPSGAVVQYVLEAADRVVEPGIWSGYVRNAVAALDCGWKVFPPVAEGRAHASVVRLSMTTAPETKGTVEVVTIPPAVMAAMRNGHGAIPQRLAVLHYGAGSALAQSYVDAMTGSVGQDVCGRHGYLHALSPDAERWRPLFSMSAGRRGQGPGPGEIGRGGSGGGRGGGGGTGGRAGAGGRRGPGGAAGSSQRIGRGGASSTGGGDGE